MKAFRYILILILLSITVYAQEAGVSVVRMWSDDADLNNPQGYGIHLYQPLGKIALRAEYSSGSSERNYPGSMAGGFLIHPEEYIIENIRAKSKVYSVELDLIVPNVISLINPLSFNLGLGVCISNMYLDKNGLTTGKKTSFERTGRYGYLFTVSLSYPGIFNLPLRPELLYKQKFISSADSAALDIEDHFAQAVGLKQLQLGISYIIN